MRNAFLRRFRSMAHARAVIFIVIIDRRCPVRGPSLYDAVGFARTIFLAPLKVHNVCVTRDSFTRPGGRDFATTN